MGRSDACSPVTWFAVLRYIELVKAARADSAPYSCEACEGTIEMRKSDVICECGAGFRRIELTSEPGTKRRYCCPACHAVLEAFNGDHLVAYRLKVQPTQGLERAKPVVLPIKLIEGSDVLGPYDPRYLALCNLAGVVRRADRRNPVDDQSALRRSPPPGRGTEAPRSLSTRPVEILGAMTPWAAKQF